MMIMQVRKPMWMVSEQSAQSPLWIFTAQSGKLEPPVTRFQNLWYGVREEIQIDPTLTNQRSNSLQIVMSLMPRWVFMSTQIIETFPTEQLKFTIRESSLNRTPQWQFCNIHWIHWRTGPLTDMKLFLKKTPVVDINPIQDGMPYKREAQIFFPMIQDCQVIGALMKNPATRSHLTKVQA